MHQIRKLRLVINAPEDPIFAKEGSLRNCPIFFSFQTFLKILPNLTNVFIFLNTGGSLTKNSFDIVCFYKGQFQSNGGPTNFCNLVPQ